MIMEELTLLLNATIRSSAISLVQPKITKPQDNNSFSSSSLSDNRYSSVSYPIHTASLNASTLLQRKPTVV